MEPYIPTKPLLRVDYSKLMKLIRKKRMTLSAFAKRTKISRADLYFMQINELMSPEGEFLVCHYLNCDICDIRDTYPTDPNDPAFL